MLLLATPCLLGAKIYKWTDAEGNVHYTTTPPPEQFEQATRLEVEAAGQSRVPPAEGGPIAGEWRAVTNDHIHELSLGPSSFTWRRMQRDRKAQPVPGTSELLAKGSYERSERRLTLRYSRDLTGQGRAGASEDFTIMRHRPPKPDALTLRGPDGKSYRFERADAIDAPVDLAARLQGSWALEGASTYLRLEDERFSMGTSGFIVRGHEDAHWKLEGRWWLEDRELVLDMQQGSGGGYGAGDTERYEVSFLDGQRLVLQRLKDGRWLRYRRP
jgi:hypothetical protein